MKNNRQKLVLILFMFFSFYTYAQKDSISNEYKTLLGDNITHGGYGAFSTGYTKIGEHNAFTGGMKGAWLINHSIGIGLAGNGFITGRQDGLIPDENYSFFTGGYGGFLIEPIFYASQPIHFSVPILIGGGGVAYMNERMMSSSSDPYPEFYDSFFVFEPGVELELNMVSFFRIALGVSYRMTSDINLTKDVLGEEIVLLDKKSLNQIVAKIVFKFGKF